MEFFNKVLAGTGHKEIPKKNRTSVWMQNTTMDGPCLTFLKNNITEDNLITIDQMNLFKQLQEQGEVPDESEIDALLAEYLEGSPVDMESIAHSSSLQNEESQASKYYEALDKQEKVLHWQSHKIQEDIFCRLKSSEIISFSTRKENALESMREIKCSYEEVREKIQRELKHNIPEALTAFLNEDVNFVNELKTVLPSEEKNQVFYESVSTIFQKRFNTQFNGDNAEVETMISVATNLGQHNYQNLKLQCEEAELEDMNNFIENTLKDVEVDSINTIYLRSLMDAGIKKAEEIQQKMLPLSEELESLYPDIVIRNVLMAYRERLCSKMESDCKFSREISDVCSEYTDLLTLLVYLSRAKLVKVDWINALSESARQKLADYKKTGSLNIMKLRKLSTDQEVFHNEALFAHEKNIILMKNHNDVINETMSKILSFVNKYLEENYAIRQEQNKLDSIIFYGPVRSKVFFCSTIRNDEMIIRRQFTSFKQMYQLLETQYHKNIEKKKEDDEFLESYKLLGLIFLAHPVQDMLRHNLKCIRVMGSRTLTIASTNISNFPSEDVQKGNLTSTT